MMPTNCYEPAKPRVFYEVCMTTDGQPMDIVLMPENAIVVTNHNGLDSIDYTVTQDWVDEAGMAIRNGNDDCVVKGDMILGSSEDFEGQCMNGSFTMNVVVYFDKEFDPEECEACNVVDLVDMGGTYEFCAYSVEIPCDPISVEC
jgi:hypothetical protein